ncbi:MAG: phosphatidylserine/phosphatidylglycerophosphate/cardiolipin synthase-like enzyme, partial [Myxococcota bacterium]
GGQWGRPGEELTMPVECDGGSDCDEDFGLLRCEIDSDCGDQGACQPVMASVTRPGQDPTWMCTGHADFLVDEIYLALIEAEEYADVSTLDAPTGRFTVGLKNALAYLDAADSAAQVRVLFGHIPGLFLDTDELLDELTEGVGDDSALTVHVGAYREGVTSWNHSKIVAADGRVLLQGGHNMWQTDYLLSAPVHDLSMRIDGSSALDAHRFLDRLWEYTCEEHWIDGWTERAVFPAHVDDCPPVYDAEPAIQYDGTGARVIAAGRLGSVGENPADEAILAAIDAAQQTLRLSLQDIGPIRIVGDLALSDWPEPVMESLTAAMARNVDVYMVLSTPGSTPGGGSNGYGNGWTTEEVAQTMEEWIEDNPALLPSGTTARELLCERLHLAPLRYTADEATWSGGEGIGNHSKFFMVDDELFYIGSHNLYVANLAEFGLFVDDTGLAAEVVEEYWAPMWQASQPGAVSGSSAPSCRF